MSVDFTIPTMTIQVGKGGKNGSFTVRGVNADDVVFLTTTYLEDLKKILAKFGESPRLQKARVADMVIEIVKDFPMLVAEMISRCADAPNEIAKFRNLSFIRQVQALQAIVILSSEDDEGDLLKKAGAGLASLLETNGLALGPLTAQLRNIIGTSVNQSQSSE
jgi:hypothetical protein